MFCHCCDDIVCIACCYTIWVLTNQHPELCFVGLRAQRTIKTSKSSLENSKRIFRGVVFYKRVVAEWPWWDWTKLPYWSRLQVKVKHISFYSFVYKLLIGKWGVMLFKTSHRRCFHIIRKSLFLILCSFILLFQMTSPEWCCRKRGMITSTPVTWRYGSPVCLVSIQYLIFLVVNGFNLWV